MKLRNFDTFIIDLDNTLMSWPELMPGAKEVVKRLRKLNKKILFVTDNSLKPRHDLASHLTKLGIPTKKEEVINSGYVAALFLKRKNYSAFALGNGPIKDLKGLKVKMRNKPPVDYVVIGDDFDLNAEKMVTVLNLLFHGAKLMTCSLGKLRVEKNRVLPGTSSLTKLYEYATDTKTINVGKPSDYFVSVLRKTIKNPKKCVVIGDSPFSDVGLAKKLGCYSVLVKSHFAKTKIKPNLFLKSIKDLLKYL